MYLLGNPYVHGSHISLSPSPPLTQTHICGLGSTRIKVSPQIRLFIYFSGYMIFPIIWRQKLHYDLSNTMHVATQAHMILRRFVVLNWMHDNKEYI